MDLNIFCTALGLNDSVRESLAPHWDDFCANVPDGLPVHFQKEFYTKYVDLCKMPSDVLPRMDEVAKITAERPELCCLANVIRYGLFVSPIVFADTNIVPDDLYGENTGIFHLLNAMSCLPLIAETHKKLGIPESNLAEMGQWITGTIAIYRAAHNGIPGHSPNQTSWLRHHIDGRLFRIGRLEYMNGFWHPNFPAVYRNRQNGSIVAICRNGAKFDESGCQLSTQIPEKPDFIAKMEVIDGKVTGTPVAPDGTVLKDRTITISLEEYEPFCAPWDEIPSIHIPGGGGMTLEAVKDSLLKARQFYRDVLKIDVKGFLCSSWILSPDWVKELPDSNMAKFRRNMFALPSGKHPQSGFFFVYGSSDIDPRKLPRTTALHEAFCRILDRGDTLRYGEVFIPADLIETVGTEYFINNCQP